MDASTGQGILSVINGIVDGLNRGLEKRKEYQFQQKKLDLEEKSLNTRGLLAENTQLKTMSEMEKRTADIAATQAKIELGQKQAEINQLNTDLNKRKVDIYDKSERRKNQQENRMETDRSENQLSNISSKLNNLSIERRKLVDDMTKADQAAGVMKNNEELAKPQRDKALQLKQDIQNKDAEIRELQDQRERIKKRVEPTPMPKGKPGASLDGTLTDDPLKGLDPIHKNMISAIQSTSSTDDLLGLLNELGDVDDPKAKDKITTVAAKQLATLYRSNPKGVTPSDVT